MDENLEIIRANEAKRLLENSLLNEALDAIEEKFEASWKDSKLTQVTLREEAFRMLSAVKEVRAHLTNFVNTGKLASAAKEQREEAAVRERNVSEWDGSPDGQHRS